MKKSKQFKSNTITVPVTGPRNPTVIPMLETTKPGRHKNQKRKQLKDSFYGY